MNPLDRIRAHSKLTDAAPQAIHQKKRGRPKGSVAQTMAKATWLQVEDFFFLRSVINGLTPTESFIRYYSHLSYDSEGNVLVPHGNALVSLSKSLISDIQAVASKSLSHAVQRIAGELDKELPDAPTDSPTRTNVEMDFEAWASTIPDGMYSENEMLERYQEFIEQSPKIDHAADQILNRSLAIQNKVKALNYLQTELARRPTPDQDCRIWFAPKISDELESIGVTNLGALLGFITKTGRKWHKYVAGFKEVRAKRVEAWLDFHVESLGAVNRSGSQWKPVPALVGLKHLQRPTPSYQGTTIDATTGDVVAPSPHLTPRFGMLPIELLSVPPEIDGSTGLFRCQAPNQFGARNDREAIITWLNGYLQANKIKTLEAYRREVERFYLWCVLVQRTALSSTSLAHAQGYQAFLQKIPPAWISNARVARSDPMWRPFRGQLTPKSQNHAIGILRNFFDALIKNGYVSSSPFASIVATAEASRGRVMDTTRSFTKADLELIRTALLSLPGLESKSPIKAALARRMRLIMSLGLTTGMRIAEISSATLESLKHPIVDGEPGEDWIIDVTGKRKKIREIPISESLYSQITAHHQDWEDLMPRAAERLRHFKSTPPLIAVLEAPILRSASQQDFVPGTAHAPRPSPYPSQSPVVTRKTNGREITDATVLANDNAALSANGIYRTMKTFFRFVQRLATDPVQKTRIAQFSPHWMRHTFAHEILASSPNDTGLKMAQELLGHASISTTAQYTKQDISAKVKAARKVNPLGL